MPRLPDHLRLPLTRRFQQALAAIIANTTPAVHRAFDNLTTYDEESINAFVAKAGPSLQAAKAASVRQAAAYYTLLAGITPPSIAPAEVVIVPNLRDPFISVWQALGSGLAYTAALDAGRARVEAVVSNFTVSTARQTGDVFVAKAHLPAPRWERIPDGGACDWCLEAANDTYDSAESADFGHDRCGCTVSMIL